MCLSLGEHNLQNCSTLFLPEAGLFGVGDNINRQTQAYNSSIHGRHRQNERQVCLHIPVLLLHLFVVEEHLFESEEI